MDDGEESETPAFIPKSPGPESASSWTRTPGRDLNATLRGDPRRVGIATSQTSDSSTNSPGVPGRDGRDVSRAVSRMPDPLSPKRTTELSGKGKGNGKKGPQGYSSDGTPSMGSSFSDLDGEFSWVGMRR